MSTNIRAVVTLVVVGVVFAPTHAAAQVYKVGSFAKNTTSASGCSSGCPTNLVAHNLGVTPKAMILWSDGKTNTSFSAHFLWGFGISDGVAANTWSAAAGSQNGVAGNSQASRRAANKVIQFLQGTTTTGTVLAEADFTSWDATNFTITWTTNDTNAYVIHYLLIGGTGVSAQAVPWGGPATNTNDCCSSTARPTTTTFQPDLVLSIGEGYFMTQCSPCTSRAVVNAGFDIGVMDVNSIMWANSFLSMGNSATKDTQRGQQATGKFIYEFNNSLVASHQAVACTTTPCLYVNGFRFNLTVGGDAGGGMNTALALHNVNYKIGTFNKCSSTGGCSNQNAITGLGFQPGVVILTSFQDVTQASPEAGSRFGFGASDGTNEASSAVTDKDAVATSVVWGVDKTTKAFMKVNNDTGTLDAEADVTMQSDGFTATWTTNDTATTEILYLALGPLNATSVTLVSFTATRLPDGKTRLEWRTGYEVDNLGFRLYREQNGKRVRITTSLLPGTALVGAGRGMSVGGRTYTWSDSGVAPDAGFVQYWLEDVDLKGKSTWHGPIALVPGTRREPR